MKLKITAFITALIVVFGSVLLVQGADYAYQLGTFEERAQLAAECGLVDNQSAYYGTAKQNLELLKCGTFGSGGEELEPTSIGTGATSADPNVTYVTDVTDDFAVGGTDSSAPLYFDTSAGDLDIDGNLVVGANATTTGVLEVVSSNTHGGIRVDQNGNTGTDIAVDGAIHAECTGNTGICFGVYSNQGSDANGSLAFLRANNSAFDQNVLEITSAATSRLLDMTASLSNYGSEIIFAELTGTSGSGSVFYGRHAGSSGEVILADVNGNSNGIIVDTEATSGDAIQVQGEKLTTGDGLQIAVDSDILTSGKAIRVLGGSSFNTDVFTVDANGNATTTGQLVVGSPTGGGQGAGTINAVAVYDDSVLLTGADYVFDDPEYEHLTVKQVSEFVKSNFHLPWVQGREEAKANRLPIGEKINQVLEAVENVWLYVEQLFANDSKQDEEIEQLNKRIEKLEALLGEGQSLCLPN